jgi:hypothetical protein
MSFLHTLRDLSPFVLLALVTAISVPTAYLAGRTEGRRNPPPVLRHGVPAKAPSTTVEAAARATAEEVLADSGLTVLDLEVRTLRPPYQVVAVVADDDGISSIRASGDSVAVAARRLAEAAANRRVAGQRS